MAEINETATTELKTRREPSGAPPWVIAIAPVALALLSLALSVYTIVEANREPEIWLSAPDVVRVSLGENAWFYVQPRLVSAAHNDRVAVVSGLRLEVAAPDGGAPVPFFWDEQGTMQYDPANRGLTWIYEADAAPLVVGPSSPQLPLCLFVGPPGWVWQSGAYRVTIVAERGENRDALRTDFAMTLATETVEAITTQPRSWREVWTESVSR